MNDREHDDWVRGQAGTFWGEEKLRLEKLAREAREAPLAPGPRGRARGKGGQSGSDIEDLLEDVILAGASLYGAYFAFTTGMRMNLSEGWHLLFCLAGLLVPAIGGHMLLSTWLGRTFLRLLAILLALGVAAICIWGFMGTGEGG